MDRSGKRNDSLSPEDQRTGKTMSLSRLLSSVDSPEGRKRVADHLAQQPFPHYEQEPGVLVRIAQDGTRTIGKFVNREFCPEKT